MDSKNDQSNMDDKPTFPQPQVNSFSDTRSSLSDHLDDGSNYLTSAYLDYEEGNIFHRFVDSFKPYDYSTIPVEYFTTNKTLQQANQNLHTAASNKDISEGSGSGDRMQPVTSQMNPTMHPNHPHFDYSTLTELERAAIITSTSPLSKTLKVRHLQMIAIGGAIGTGLFIGSGQSLAAAGPFGLLIAWLAMSLVIYVTMSSLAELSVAFPVSGAFVTFNTIFVNQSWGFAMAWNYAIQWLVTLPLELVAASITIQYWNPSVNPAVFVAIFYVVIMVINLFGVRGYGEAEFYFSIIKVIAVVGFVILSIIIVSGGAPPNHEYIGGRNWRKPDGGMFNEDSPFKNICSILFTAAFAYSGVELFALALCETMNPKKAIPIAIKQVFWRILIFYILSIIMIGLLVLYHNEALLGQNVDGTVLSNAARVNINTSPFIIAITQAQIPALPSIMNVVIIITVLSVGNASVYGSSRTMAALGALKQGPAILNYIDRKGRPLVALAVQFVIGLLCFLVAAPGDTSINVFDWLLALSGCCSIFTWWSICLCHIRFRAALSHRARDPRDELVYTSNLINSYYGLIALAVTLALEFWACLFPPGNGGKADATSFFQTYLGAVVVAAMYVGHKIYAAIFLDDPLFKFYLTVEEIDVDTGRRDIDLEFLKQQIAEDREAHRLSPWYMKIYRFFC